MTQLRGIDGETYAVAQGPLTLTGVSVDQAAVVFKLECQHLEEFQMGQRWRE